MNLLVPYVDLKHDMTVSNKLYSTARFGSHKIQ